MLRALRSAWYESFRACPFPLELHRGYWTPQNSHLPLATVCCAVSRRFCARLQPRSASSRASYQEGFYQAFQDSALPGLSLRSVSQCLFRLTRGIVTIDTETNDHHRGLHVRHNEDSLTEFVLSSILDPSIHEGSRRRVKNSALHFCKPPLCLGKLPVP